MEAHRDLVTRARRPPGRRDEAITSDAVDPRRIYNFELWDSWEAVEEWRPQAHAPDTGITVHDVEVTAYEIARSRPPF